MITDWPVETMWRDKTGFFQGLSIQLAVRPLSHVLKSLSVKLYGNTTHWSVYWLIIVNSNILVLVQYQSPVPHFDKLDALLFKFHFHFKEMNAFVQQGCIKGYQMWQQRHL